MVNRSNLIAAIDYSLTSPAICMYKAGEPELFSSYRAMTLTNNKVGKKSVEVLGSDIEIIWNEMIEHQQQRYEFISDQFMNFISKNNVSKVYIESYSYSSTGRVFHIAENTELLKYKLWKSGFDPVLVPPSVIKKYATGKGNANKAAMYKSFIETSGFDFHVKNEEKIGNPQSDIIDAFWLCKYAVEKEK